MNIEIKDIELIDRYLSGSLDAASKEAFNNRLQTDASFKELLSDVKSTNELVKANEFAQVQAQLDSFSYDSAPWWQSNTTRYLAVAGVAAVVTTAVWMSSSDDKPASVKETRTVIETPASKAPEATVVQPNAKNIVSAPTRKSDKEQSNNFMPEIDWVKSNNEHNSVQEVVAAQKDTVPVLSPTPTGPAAVPPQQDPVVSNPSTHKTKVDSSATPSTLPAPTPGQRNFYLQLPNQNWVYPDYIKNGNLHIVNESGAVMTDIVLDGSNESWNGTDRYGNTVPAGLYFYKFTDATSGQVFTGSITVVY